MLTITSKLAASKKWNPYIRGEWAISNTLNIKAPHLEPPDKGPKYKQEHPFYWKEQFRSYEPDELRWSWNPKTGDLVVGADADHIAQINSRYPNIDQWVRGFYIPSKNQVIVRPFYWEQNEKNAERVGWDDKHEALNAELIGTIVYLLEATLPKKVKQWEFNVDNEWLSQVLKGRV